MELRQLRYFVAVAEEGHITRAAERLGMEQPSLSEQIKTLETEMGVPLLKRHPRGVDLTAAGDALLQRARAMLASADDTKEDLERAEKGIVGKLAIGATGAFVWHPLLANTIRAFRRSYPLVALQLRETNMQELIDMTARGEVDLAITYFAPSKSPGIVFEKWFDTTPMVVLPRNHRLLDANQPGSARRISLRQLAAEPWVVFRRIGPSGMYAHLLQACERVGFTPRIAAQADQTGSAVALVAADVGIYFAPSVIEGHRSAEVVYCHLDDAPGLHEPYKFTYVANNHNPALANFIAVARECAAEFEHERGPLSLTGRRRRATP
jgi:DNA-binding transcriptional LysR family regulator